MPNHRTPAQVMTLRPSTRATCVALFLLLFSLWPIGDRYIGYGMLLAGMTITAMVFAFAACLAEREMSVGRRVKRIATLLGTFCLAALVWGFFLLPKL